MRAFYRTYILEHPDCIPDGQERLRWVAGRLKIGTPLVFAAATYLRQTWTVKTVGGEPVSIGSRVDTKKKGKGQEPRDGRPVTTAYVDGLGPQDAQAAPHVATGAEPAGARVVRAQVAIAPESDFLDDLFRSKKR